MAMRSKLRHLSPNEKREFIQRVRRSEYGDINSHVKWLGEKGYKFSRSAVHRYMQGIQKVDAASGILPARMLEVSRSQRGERRRLLEQLGRVEFERAQVVARLEAVGIDEPGADTDSPSAPTLDGASPPTLKV